MFPTSIQMFLHQKGLIRPLYKFWEIKMKNTIKKIYKPLLILTLLCFTFSASAFLTVGATPDCDYQNIEDAYNDFGDNIIRVANDKIYSEVFIIERTLSFTGGYNSCADAEINAVSNTRTKWRLGVNADSNSFSASIIGINNFEIYDGNGNTFGSAGGIRVAGNTVVIVNNSDIHHNSSIEGGGIRITGVAARVQINDTIIRDNSASTFGGGVFCEYSSRFTMLGNSVIKNNTASDNGGGIYASDACEVESKSGNVAGNLGIINNVATRGGGVYLITGAKMQLTGDDQHPALIAGNRATLDIEYGIMPLLGGAGVYVSGVGTSFIGTNAHINTNWGKYHGAGFAVNYGAHFTMKRLNSPCWDNDKCSSLSNNFLVDNTNLASGAAGYEQYDDSVVDISGTYIAGNKADLVSVLVNGGGNNYLRLESNLIVANDAYLQATAANTFEIGPSVLFDFFYNTMVSNQAFTSFWYHSHLSAEINVFNSIIYDQGDILVSTGTGAPVIEFNCNFVHENASLNGITANIDNLVLNPNFVDSANGDYHLNNQSFARDLCAAVPNSINSKDLNGNDRGYDIQSLIDFRGRYDAGAFEFHPFVESVFADGFE